MRVLNLVSILLVSVISTHAAGQTCAANGSNAATERSPYAPTEPELEIETDTQKRWSFSISAYTYIINDDQDYVQTTFSADYDWLHLEARHQYEDLDTASVWVGYNFSFGEELTFDFTPMVGGVFGDTQGAAVGYITALGWRQFELYSEGEVVFAKDDSAEDFFYSWSELTWSPVDWFRLGLTAQQTKIRAEGTHFEVGPMIGLTYESFDFTGYLLYPDEGHPTVVLGIGLEF